MFGQTNVFAKVWIMGLYEFLRHFAHKGRKKKKKSHFPDVGQSVLVQQDDVMSATLQSLFLQ